jgi:hypothetical protein
MVDKLVISNRVALTAKYGAPGFAAVQSALAAMIAADGARGLTTQILFIDDAAQMAAVGGYPVVGAADQRGAKAAVDAAHAALAPDYLMLLDGPDVVPHIELAAIAGLSDGDLNIPSDLPYASSAPWSLLASTFLGVTRVVGRLPAAPGVASAAQLVALIGAAATHAPRPAAAFTPPFAISADVWSASTQLSVASTFGPGMVVELAPPATHPGIDADLPRLAHFINCHGAQASDEFYGQSGSTYPMAMSSLGAGPHISPQTVATAECCYGAELYDYLTVGTAQPICVAYLAAGATAFLGSTNIAYGPATGNAQADLLTQYFLQHVLAGATTGRALLQARQDFIRTQRMANPSNLKTVAQYVLLGDPSSQPCLAPAAHGMTAVADFLKATASAAVMDPGLERKSRRMALESEGFAIDATASRLGPEIAGSQPLLDQLRQLATQRGIVAQTITVLEVTGGDLFLRAVKNIGGDHRVATVVEASPASKGWRGPSIKLLVAHIVGERIVSVEHSESR